VFVREHRLESRRCVYDFIRHRMIRRKAFALIVHTVLHIEVHSVVLLSTVLIACALDVIVVSVHVAAEAADVPAAAS